MQLTWPEHRKHQRHDVLVFVVQQAGLPQAAQRERRRRKTAFDKRQTRHLRQWELAGDDLVDGPSDLHHVVLHALIDVAEIGKRRSVANIDLQRAAALLGDLLGPLVEKHTVRAAGRAERGEQQARFLGDAAA
jgi:hypothetical protein